MEMELLALAYRFAGLQKLDEPVLIVVGAKDQTTRSAISTKLFEAAKMPSAMKKLLIVPGAGHNNSTADPRFRSAFLRLIAVATR